MASAEHAVPQTSLLAVVVRLSPALPVVDVMVLDDQLGVEHSQQPREGVGGRSMQTQTAVARQLGEHHVLVAHPPVIEAHGQAHELEREERQQRDTGDIEELLLVVGVQGEQRVGMLGEMVGAMVLPEAGDVVHEPVVPVEPEVEDDAVQADLEGQPQPADGVRGLRGAVGQEDREHGAEGGRGDERVGDLGDADVRDTVALVLVAVQEPVDVTQAAEDVHLVDGDQLEGGHVEKEGTKRAQVLACVEHVGVVQSEGDERVHQHPAVEV